MGFLKFLDLSYNKLTVLTTNTLSGLHKLERLKINNNQIKTIELGAFDHLPSIKRIDVGDNPLICDCNIAWMLAWLDVVGTKAMCGSPPSLGNTMIKKLKTNDLTCDVPMIPTLGVVKYNKAGWVEDLPSLITGRKNHGCSHYTDSSDQLVSSSPPFTRSLFPLSRST